MHRILLNTSRFRAQNLRLVPAGKTASAGMARPASARAPSPTSSRCTRLEALAESARHPGPPSPLSLRSNTRRDTASLPCQVYIIEWTVNLPFQQALLAVSPLWLQMTSQLSFICPHRGHGVGLPSASAGEPLEVVEGLDFLAVRACDWAVQDAFCISLRQKDPRRSA
jgi:hypothetical protein